MSAGSSVGPGRRIGGRWFRLRLALGSQLLEWVRVGSIGIGRLGRGAAGVPEDRDVADLPRREIEQHHLARRVVADLADELDVRPRSGRGRSDADRGPGRLLLRAAKPEVRATDDDDHARQPTPQPAESRSRPRLRPAQYVSANGSSDLRPHPASNWDRVAQGSRDWRERRRGLRGEPMDGVRDDQARGRQSDEGTDELVDANDPVQHGARVDSGEEPEPGGEDARVHDGSIGAIPPMRQSTSGTGDRRPKAYAPRLVLVRVPLLNKPGGDDDRVEPDSGKDLDRAPVAVDVVGPGNDLIDD